MRHHEPLFIRSPIGFKLYISYTIFDQTVFDFDTGSWAFHISPPQAVRRRSPFGKTSNSLILRDFLRTETPGGRGGVPYTKGQGCARRPDLKASTSDVRIGGRPGGVRFLGHGGRRMGRLGARADQNAPTSSPKGT